MTPEVLEALEVLDLAAGDGESVRARAVSLPPVTSSEAPPERPWHGSHVAEGDPLVSVEGRLLEMAQARFPADVPRGVHVGVDDPLLSVEGRALHAVEGPAPAEPTRGAHVGRTDPLLCVERRAIHAKKWGTVDAEVLADAHVDERDPLLEIELRALHVRQCEPGGIILSRLDATIGANPEPVSAPEVLSVVRDLSASSVGASSVGDGTSMTSLTAEAPAKPSAKRGHKARAAARRRWGLVPLAGAAGAVVVGLGAGTAVAFIVSDGVGHGSGSVQAMAGSPVAAPVSAATGNADLVPGGTGTAYFSVHNPASTSVTFDHVSGATVVSDNTGLCSNSFVSIAQQLPAALPTPLTVAPGGTSGTQALAHLVALAPNAPSSCQGVTFTVSMTLSGRSSS